MKDPAELPWGDLGVDIVLESTGIFTDAIEGEGPPRCGREEGDHQRAGEGRGCHASSSASTRAAYDPDRHSIISNASCTTNCLAPAAKVVHDRFGIRRGLMNTIHSYTNDQRVLDVAHKDPASGARGCAQHHPDDDRRREGARAGDPDLKGQASTASACACPTPTVSVVDFTADIERRHDRGGAERRVPRGRQRAR